MTLSKSMGPSGLGSFAGNSAAMRLTVNAVTHPNTTMRLMELS